MVWVLSIPLQSPWYPRSGLPVVLGGAAGPPMPCSACLALLYSALLCERCCHDLSPLLGCGQAAS